MTTDGEKETQERESRERNIKILRGEYQQLANSVCLALRDLPSENERLRDRMDMVEQELKDAYALPDDWKSWQEYFSLFHRLWNHVKGSCPCHRP